MSSIAKKAIPRTAGEPEKRALRCDHYYNSRASEADLLADVDAWGIDQQRGDASAPKTIEGLLASYYGDVRAGKKTTKVTAARKQAVERFLRHYGFTAATSLKSQPAAKTIVTQLAQFCQIWLVRRSIVGAATADGSDVSSWYLIPMAARFLKWLEALAAENGATVTPPR